MLIFRESPIVQFLSTHINSILIILIATVVFIFALWKLPLWQVDKYKELKPEQTATLINEYRKTLAQIIGGIVLLFGLYFNFRAINYTANNLIVAQERQITERFTRAINQLGDEKLAIRLGGIYALERIAKDSEKDHWPIMEILASCVRENASIHYNTNAKRDTTRIETDIQTILTVIGRRNTDYDTKDRILDLSATDLHGAKLSFGVFERANFYRTNFKKTDLRNAKLKGALFREADLCGANFIEADLGKTRLHGANLDSANLEGAILQDATLWNATLRKAFLLDANLQGAALWGAKLQGADFGNAKLQRADFWNARLQGANLSNTNLEEAILWEVNLYGASLKGANLSYADLKGITNWKRTSDLTGANIFQIKSAPEGFIEFAKSKGAIEKEPEY